MLQGSNHRVQSGIQDNGRTAQAVHRGAGAFGAFEQFAAVEFDGEVGILQQIPGQDENDGFMRLHELLLQQLLQTCERHRRRRFASDTFGAYLGLGLSNLNFACLLYTSDAADE